MQVLGLAKFFCENDLVHRDLWVFKNKQTDPFNNKLMDACWLLNRLPETLRQDGMRGNFPIVG
jgi:hypothetical protein